MAMATTPWNQWALLSTQEEEAARSLPTAELAESTAQWPEGSLATLKAATRCNRCAEDASEDSCSARPAVSWRMLCLAVVPFSSSVERASSSRSLEPRTASSTWVGQVE